MCNTTIRYRDKNSLGILFTISMSVAFAQNMGVFRFNYLQQYVIACFWIVIGLGQLSHNGRKKNSGDDDIKFYFKMFLIPWLVFWVQTLVIYASSNGNNNYFTTSIINLTTMTITILCATASVYIFKEHIVKYCIYAISICLVIVCIYGITQDGPFVIIKNAYMILTTGESTNNIFEIHDITFAAGLIWIFYILNNSVATIKKKKYLFLSLFIIFMGFKRIQILALLCIFGMTIIFKMGKRGLRKITIILSSLVLMVTAFLYVWAIKVGVLSQYVYTNGINTMGRIKMYSFVADYYDFKASFLGHGYAYTVRLLHENGFQYVLHSDILRVFIEFGFLVFTFWLVYCLLYCRKRIERKYSLMQSEVYYLLTFYLFLLHFTDNTVNYFVTQYIYMILIMYMAIKETRLNMNNIKTIG